MALTLTAQALATPAKSASTPTPAILPSANTTATSSLHTLTLPPANSQLAQNTPPNNPSAIGSLLDALDNASKGNRAGAIKNVQQATDAAAATAQGFLNNTTANTPGLNQIGNTLIDLAQAGTKAAINITDMTWSKNPTQNLQTLSNIQQLLSTASTSTVVDLDKQMRNLSSSNPQMIPAATELSRFLKETSSLYDQVKTQGFDPSSIHPDLDKFMKRLSATSKDLGNCIDSYSDYHKKAQGLPQMGTFADVKDQITSRFSSDPTHAIQRVERNKAAQAAQRDWGSFKKNFDDLTAGRF